MSRAGSQGRKGHGEPLGLGAPSTSEQGPQQRKVPECIPEAWCLNRGPVYSSERPLQKRPPAVSPPTLAPRFWWLNRAVSAGSQGHAEGSASGSRERPLPCREGNPRGSEQSFPAVLKETAALGCGCGSGETLAGVLSGSRSAVEVELAQHSPPWMVGDSRAGPESHPDLHPRKFVHTGQAHLSPSACHGPPLRGR